MWAAFGASWKNTCWLFSRCDNPHKDFAKLGHGYFGTPAALHFVGFKGDEYGRAVRLFGRPDFIHRMGDLRLYLGGELAHHDTVVFANGYDNRCYLMSFNDSEKM
jgi:hypothetical protein